MRVDMIQAIDVHGHYGTYTRAGQYDRGQSPQCSAFCSADAQEVVRRARKAQTCLTIVSPLAALLPRGEGDPVAGNRDAARIVAQTDGLLQWVVLDPLHPETYAQAEEMLPLPKCVGIKLHPEEHRYAVAEHGAALFEFAAKHHAVVLGHSSEQLSLAADYLRFANAFPEVKVILAHLGFGWDGHLDHQVRAIQESKHGNVFTDTSSVKSITPNLIEWAVRAVGPERILYGTDTPLYFAPNQRARIDHADLSDYDKRLILRDNAVRLLALEALTEWRAGSVSDPSPPVVHAPLVPRT
jgi:predicted TIM-barrel fold metal-dependent hydrolase